MMNVGEALAGVGHGIEIAADILVVTVTCAVILALVLGSLRDFLKSFTEGYKGNLTIGQDSISQEPISRAQANVLVPKVKGFFRTIADAAKEANEDAHGERLLRDVQSTFSCLENLDGKISYVAMSGYLQIQDRLGGQMLNWSREGRIKVGRTMQRQARVAIDTDMAGGYAKWLAGAWLESNERNSLKAQQAHALLGDLANEIRKKLSN